METDLPLIRTKKTQNETLASIKPSRKSLIWLIIWCGFHLFALLMSYSYISIFNKGGILRHPDETKFWPFVEFFLPLRNTLDPHSKISGYIFEEFFSV